MAIRYCPRCRAKVEDVGGYCLLGHSFPEENDLLREIRAEVNAAFDRAKIQIDGGFPIVEEEVREPEPALVTAPSAIRELAAENGAGPEATAPSAFQALADENAADDDSALDEEEFVARRRARATAAWKRLQERPAPPGGDPISAFAPAPRMDWGPKASLLRRAAKDKQPGAAPSA